MAMIKNAEIWYVKCDPKRPDSTYNKKNPSWQVQLRTADPEQRDLWKKQGLNVKLLTQKDPNADKDLDPDDIPKVPVLTADGKKQWRVNLKKGSIKANGEKAEPVKVINGGLDEVDSNTIANGSIANVRVFQYDYKDKDSGKEGIASMLMAIQVIKHIVYTPKARDDDFDMVDTEVVQQEVGMDDAEEDASGPGPGTGGPKTAPKANPAANPARNADEF
jgi:hypothetical protein